MSERSGSGAESLVAGDFEKINVGDELPSLTYTLDQMELWKYAAASGDFNPLHVDRDYGEKVGFGGTISHGLLTYARSIKCVTDWVGNPCMLKSYSARFKAPVRPGDTVTIKGKVISKEIDDGKKSVIIEIIVVNQDETKILAGCEAVVEL